jgi:hypothetical protein
MASKPEAKTESRRPRANVPLSAIPSALRKLKRRLEEIEALPTPMERTDIAGVAHVLANKVNATIDDVFGVGSRASRACIGGLIRFSAEVDEPSVSAACWTPASMRNPTVTAGAEQ